MPVADRDGGRWRQETGKKNTVVGGHVGCRSAVHDPGVGALNRHLVEGGDQAGLILGSVRRGRRELGRREGSLSLMQRWGRWGRR